MTLIPDFVKNHKKIVEHCLNNLDKFMPRRDNGGHMGPLPVQSKFCSWLDGNMGDEFLDLIFEESGFDESLRDMYYFVQIQKYEPGDFIVPHRDNYDVQTLHLVTLTDSETDGLILLDGEDLVKVYDKGGQKIEVDLNDWHWVDPVKDLRFSLVVGE